MKRSDKIKKLISRIEWFLKEEKVSDTGGYAPVDPKEILEIYEIFNAIARLKYIADCDNDIPIDIDVLDRTRFEGSVGDIPLPYMHKAKTDEEIDEIIALASCNAISAMTRLNQIIRCRKDYITHIAETAAKEKARQQRKAQVPA